MRRSTELRQERAKLIEDAGKILTRVYETEGRSPNEEERQEFDRLHARADELKVEIEAIERQEERERELASLRAGDPGAPAGPSNDPRENANLETEAFRAWMRWGVAGMTPEQRAVANWADAAQIREAQAALPPELRAQTVTTTGGGYLIAQEFQSELDKVLLAFGGMREASRILTTSTGATLDWPTVDDTSNTGELLDINLQVNQQDIAFSQVQFEAFKYSSKAVLVPVELSQDSAIDIDGIVRDLLAERLGRITNNHLTVGDGTSKPRGVVTAAADSTFGTDAGGALTYLNMLNLEHSIDPAYRGNPGVAFMVQDDGLKKIKSVLDGNNRPIFRGGLESPGGVDTVLGHPVIVNQDVPSAGTTANKAYLFGDFKKYITRIVRPMVMLRLVERYADYHQIGFFAFERLDGDLLNTNAVKWMDVTA